MPSRYEQKPSIPCSDVSLNAEGPYRIGRARVMQAS